MIIAYIFLIKNAFQVLLRPYPVISQSSFLSPFVYGSFVFILLEKKFKNFFNIKVNNYASPACSSGEELDYDSG